MLTLRLGLVVWLCWSCGGAEAADDDELYDIPVGSVVAPGGEDELALDPVGAPERGSSSPGAGRNEAPGRSVSRPGLHALTPAGELTESELYDALAQAPVVCFGETHDDAAHHLAQARAADELSARSRQAGTPFALGFEMFQTPFQAVLTDYVLRRIDERQLSRGSEYALRWGYDFALYRPLLELARERGLPALALNAPAELTQTIANSGLEGLSPEDQENLPDLDLNDPDHRAYVSELLGASHSTAATQDGAPSNAYLVQVVWDETMAETAAQWLSSAGDGARLLIIAGLGHCHHSGIPARVTRRTGLPARAVAPVRQSRLGLPGFPTLEHYDMLVVIHD
jgi:uncharacterized iron-regulated protein